MVTPLHPPAARFEGGLVEVGPGYRMALLARDIDGRNT